MNITFRQGSDVLSEKVLARAQAKLERLTRFFTEGNFEALAYVDVERESGSQSSDAMWRTSINLDLAGERLNAVQMASTPEKAVDLAIKDLKRGVRRTKGKERSIAKRGSSMLKRLRRGFA